MNNIEQQKELVKRLEDIITFVKLASSLGQLEAISECISWFHLDRIIDGRNIEK